jgi:thiosulfate/3-mercaptopyruvate sulfurtransferase
VPGARSAPWQGNLDDDGRFRSADELKERFADLGAVDDVVCYCGSGVSACANLLALERAGVTSTKLYVASWSGWSADPTRSVATGPE